MDTGDATTGLTYTTLAALRRTYEEMPRQLAFRATCHAEWSAWRDALSAKVAELLGGFPLRRCPLDTVLLDSTHEDGYRIEKVAFQSEPGLHVPCYVLIPDDVQPPYRPVLALHGHGTDGATYLLGRVMDEAHRAKEERAIRDWNADYALQLVKKGYLVLVPVQRGIGERVDPEPGVTRWEGAGRSSCQMLQFHAVLLGKTVLGMRVWDVMRTLDYLATRPEPLTGKLGCVGLSGGATTTLFTAALDPRIDVAVVSGYFNLFRTSIMAMVHCDCGYVPGILQYAEVPDIAGLIAPRPLLIESGTQDGIFPIAGTEAAYTQLRRVYEFLGATERLDKDIFDGGHRFSGRKAFAWLERWLA